MVDTQRFHLRTGRLIQLLNGRTIAERRHATEEFNDGMVFSDQSLNKNELFSVRMDKKISSWSGSIEIGLSATNPSDIEIPKGAIAMKQGSWLLSGTSVNVDGNVTIDDYCRDLDSLDIGDTVGIMRNDQNEIHLFVNGLDQGVAAFCELNTLWVMVNLYGKCAGVSIVSDANSAPSLPTNIADDMTFSEMLFNVVPTNNSTGSDARHYARLMEHQSCSLDSESLAFYSKCGSLIQLLDLGTTAIRARHQDEFNNGVVMTNRTLKNDELFEIRINKLTEKWSGSIEMGVTTHAPDLLEIPSTMTNLRSGTVMLSGCGIITNGKGTRKEYLDFHLDELKVGDYIGLIRRERGTLHFFINGVDQGVAANNIPPHVYGVVDLYGRAVSVSIVPHHSVFERNRRNKAVADRLLLDPHLFEEYGPLLFSPTCGKHIQLSSCKKTVCRQDPLENFNHAVVLSARTLEPGEVFTVRVDDVVDKWSGSLEIGVTTYSPDSLNFPATMTNVRSGTWIMTTTGVMINGVTVVDDYGSNVECLAVGDTLGVCRKANGNLHFYINGVDQGLASSNVPENTYAMIDLYGQVTKATLVENAKGNEECLHLESNAEDEVGSIMNQGGGKRFGVKRTKLCAVSDNMTSAYRKNPGYFYDGSIAVVNSRLKVGEPCEFEINKVVSHWTGSLELGVTTETDLSTFPPSLIDVKKSICVWTGRSVFENGHLITDEFTYDTEELKPGSRIGLMLTESRGVVGYFEGVDIGVVFPRAEKNVFPIINLYGKCAQVTLVGNNKRSNIEKEEEISQERLLELSAYTVFKNNHRFYDYLPDMCHVFINEFKVVLERHMQEESGQPPILYSAKPLRIGDMFEVLINDTASRVDSLTLGVITLGKSSLKTVAPTSKHIEDLYKYQPCCLISGRGVFSNGVMVQQFYCPELFHVNYDDKVGIMLYEDETLQLFLNGKSVGKISGGFSMNELPHFVLHMGCRVTCLEVVDNAANIKEMKGPPSISDDSSSEEDNGLYNIVKCNVKETTLYPLSRILCGKNVRVTEDGLTATRVGSYNQALVFTAEPMTVNSLFQVKIKSLDEKWKSSLSVGVTGIAPTEVKLTVDALKMTKLTWLIHNDSVFKNGRKIKEKYGLGLQTVQVSQVLGLLIDSSRNLHLYVNGIDQGVAVSELPEICYGVVDLYGSCDEIEVIKEQREQLPLEICGNEEKTSAIRQHCGPEFHSSDKTCSYQELCGRYLKTLAIPAQFFTDTIACFCQSCFKSSADTIHKYQGEPPQQFTQPVGWCKFALRTHPNVDINAVSKHWNVAFYSVKVGCIRKLLDLGEIPVESDPVVDLRNDLFVDENLPKKNVSVVISPMISSIPEQKSQNIKTFTDLCTGKSYTVRLAFQLFIQPSTFKVKANSAHTNPDTTAENVEWIMKESSTTILSHLLLKLEYLK